MRNLWRCLTSPWRCLTGTLGFIDERPASRRQVFASLIIVLVVMGAGFSVGLWKLSGETAENERQSVEIARATRAASETRHLVDFAFCNRIADVHGKILIVEVPLRNMIDGFIALVPPGRELRGEAKALVAGLRRSHDQLRKVQVELKRERDRDCVMTARPPNHEEQRLDDIIPDDPPPAPRPRLGPRTETTTVPGPSSTRTVTGPSRTTTRTETITRRELLPGVERTVPGPTVTLPAITETVTVTVPGPTQTVTTEVPVVFPPQTVTVTVPEPPAPPETTTSP